MGDVVNLNKYRKERGRESEKRVAQENRVRFGRSGAEKAQDRRLGERIQNILDGKKREPGAGTPEVSGTPPEEPQPKSQ